MHSHRPIRLDFRLGTTTSEYTGSARKFPCLTFCNKYIDFDINHHILGQ